MTETPSVDDVIAGLKTFNVRFADETERQAQARRNLLVAQAISAITTLKAKADALDVAEKALEPFAEACSHLGPIYPEGAETLDGIKVVEWFAAATALNTIRKAKP